MSQQYTVVSVIPRTVLQPDGRVAEVEVITFTIPRGTRHSIEVAKADATADAVRRRLDSESARLMAIYAL